MCTSSNGNEHQLSKLYQLLELNSPAAPTVSRIRKWEDDLKITLSEEQWGTICTNLYKASRSTAAQETNYKLATRWYRTPDVLHRIFPTVPNTCWRCEQEVGTLLHIWWECREIQRFWKDVTQAIQLITGDRIITNPATCLLSHEVQLPRQALLAQLLTAARMTIPRKWRSKQNPTVEDWIRQVENTKEMEEIRACKSDCTRLHAETWDPWVEFRKDRTV